MAPVSGMLHQMGIQMLRYLDDWLISATSEEAYCSPRDKVIDLCQTLNIKINFKRSQLILTQQAFYLGMEIHSEFEVFPDNPTPNQPHWDYQSISATEPTTSPPVANTTGMPDTPHSVDSRRTPALQISSVVSESAMGLQRSTTKDQVEQRHLFGPVLVGKPIKASERSSPHQRIPRPHTLV